MCRTLTLVSPPPPSPPPSLPSLPPPPSLPLPPPLPETAADTLSPRLKEQYTQHANILDQDELQVDTQMVQLKEDASDELRELDYYARLETVEEFRDEVESVSLKQVMSIITAAKPGTCISVTGPRGIGKTTFIRRVCYCWALGYVLRQYKLLFSIDLSTAAGEPLNDLSELLTAALTSTQAFTQTEIRNVVKSVVKTKSERVLVVLDHFSQQHSELLLNILKSKQVTVLVSSSHAVKCARCESYFHMLGLTDRQISQQVLHYCHDNHSRAEHFLQYLSSVPNFSILKRVPVYLSGLLCVFESISTAHAPRTLMSFLSCLVLLMLNLSQSELNRTAELLTFRSIYDILRSPPCPTWVLFWIVCRLLHEKHKSLFHRSELVVWPSALSLMRPVHIALPLQSGEWLLLTQYPLLQDFLVSLRLCGLQQPVEETLQYLDTHEELHYFCFKLMSHIQMERAKSKNFVTVMSHSYEDDYTPGSSSESVVVADTAVSARAMYWYTFSSREVTFTRCDFSPAAAAFLSSSIGHGSTVHTLASDSRWVEYVRCVLLYCTGSKCVSVCCTYAHLSSDARSVVLNSVDSAVHPLVPANSINRSVTSFSRFATIFFWLS